jgi:hypothetical protein
MTPIVIPKSYSPQNFQFEQQLEKHRPHYPPNTGSVVLDTCGKRYIMCTANIK